MFSWKPLAWAAAIMLVAFLIRVLDISHFPIALNGDEASFGLGAVGFLNGDWNNIFSLTGYPFPLYIFSSRPVPSISLDKPPLLCAFRPSSLDR